MAAFQIGVMVDSFHLGLKEGIQKSREVGAAGIQIYAVSGEMAPENLKPARRKEILDMIQSNGLVVSALCGDLGGQGFALAEDNPWKVQKSKEIVDLALDLGTHVITTHIGVIPEKESHPRWQVLRAACEDMGTCSEGWWSHQSLSRFQESECHPSGHCQQRYNNPAHFPYGSLRQTIF